MTISQRRRSASVTAPVGAVAALAASLLTGCGSDEPAPEYEAVCQEQAQQVRAEDDKCEEDDDGGYVHGGHSWVYFPIGSSYPATGQRLTPGSYVTTLPAGKAAAFGGANVKGGTVARGGFGGRAGVSVGG